MRTEIVLDDEQAAEVKTLYQAPGLCVLCLDRLGFERSVFCRPMSNGKTIQINCLVFCMGCTSAIEQSITACRKLLKQ